MSSSGIKHQDIHSCTVSGHVSNIKGKYMLSI